MEPQQSKQDESASCMDPKAMEEWARLSSPGEGHEFLTRYVGQWKTRMRVWMGGPDAPPTDSSGVAEIRLALGGRFLHETQQGRMMGAPTESIGLLGYDNYRQMYVGSFASSMSTALQTLTGSIDRRTGHLVLYGEMDEPNVAIGRLLKFVHRHLSENEVVVDIFDLHAGEGYKVIEIQYLRA